MAIGLYTSRVVLDILGISDYGIYNVVGGVITMATFLNSAMVSATQRFMSYELGSGDFLSQNKVFCSSINIHFIVCLIIFLLAETLGLWFVNSQLNIPEERVVAANWVYQASITSFVINVISIPYNSLIVAHERMSAFAYISIIEVILKLIIVYLLLVIPFDKLICYSIMMVIVAFIIRLCYTIYCKRHFKESIYHLNLYDKQLLRKMFSFAGWSLLGNLGFSFKDQCSNILVNIFFGPTVNAARSVGLHVSTLINTFATNFTMAMAPQITKQYAAGNIEESRKLVFAGSRYSFYLLSIISVPVFLNIDYVLDLWLVEVPEFASDFLKLSLLTSLLFALSRCVTTAIQATGNVKWFQIGVSIILLSELPAAWILLKIGFPPYSVMWPTVFTYLIAVFFRFFIIRYYLPEYDFKEYFIYVVLRCLGILAISYYISLQLFQGFDVSFSSFLITSFASLIITTITIFFLGINHNERIFIIDKIEDSFNFLCKRFLHR